MKPLEELLEIAKSAKELKEKSTQVVAWYPHGDEDGTVRGPFCRWLKITEVAPEYKKHVAHITDEARYAAFAMNELPTLADAVIDLITQLKDAQGEIEKLKTGLGVAGEFIKRNEQLEKDNEAYKHVNSCLMAEITDLKKRNGWLESGFIHTCHDECQRPLCLANRENTKLEQRLAECETVVKFYGDKDNWIDPNKERQHMEKQLRFVPEDFDNVLTTYGTYCRIAADQANKRLAEMLSDAKEEMSYDVHTCHNDCKRHACVMRRKIESLTKKNEIFLKALEHSANGCLVPPDGGSPDVYDHINNARQAIKDVEGLG